MKDIKEEMESLRRLQDQAANLQKSAETDIAKASKKMKALQKRIKRGETTGDAIKDFVLARYGFLSDEIENVYRDIQERVAKSAGEFVFVFSAWDKHEGCAGFGGKGYFVRQNNLYLGILEKGQADFSVPESGVIFPTKKHIVCGGRKGGARLVNKNLSEHLINVEYWTKADFGLNLKDDAKQSAYFQTISVFGRDEKTSPELFLKVGDKETNKWFNEEIEFLRPFRDMCKTLGRPNEEFFKRYGRILEHMLRQE